MDSCVSHLPLVQNRYALSEMFGYFALFSLNHGLHIFSFNAWDNPVASSTRRNGLFLNFNFLADHSRTNGGMCSLHVRGMHQLLVTSEGRFIPDRNYYISDRLLDEIDTKGVVFKGN